MRLSATAFFLVGAAALVSLAAPAASPKKGAAPKNKKTVKSSAIQGKARGKGSTKRPVGRRTTRRQGSYNPYVGQQRPAPERIQEIERALAEKGFMTAEPDVNWDQASIDAVKRFQQSENLPADGRLSALTLIALGMARPTAAAAPVSLPAPPTLPVSEPVATAPPAPPPPAPVPEVKAAPMATPPPPPPPAPAVVVPAPAKGPAKNLPLVVPDTSIPSESAP